MYINVRFNMYVVTQANDTILYSSYVIHYPSWDVACFIVVAQLRCMHAHVMWHDCKLVIFHSQCFFLFLFFEVTTWKIMPSVVCEDHCLLEPSCQGHWLEFFWNVSTLITIMHSIMTSWKLYLLVVGMLVGLGSGIWLGVAAVLVTIVSFVTVNTASNNGWH